MKNEISHILLLEACAAVPEKLLKKYKKAYIYSGKCSYAEKLPCDLMGEVERFESFYRAGKIIDEVYASYIEERDSSILNSIMNDSNGHIIIKRSILLQLGKLIKSFILVDRFSKKYASKEKISFIPEVFPYSVYQIIIQRKDLFPDNVVIPKWYINKMRAMEIKNKYINILKMLLYPTFLLLKMEIKFLVKTQKKNYRYGIHVWNSWIDSVSTPYRVDFIEDQDCVNKSNTLYIVDGDITRPNIDKIKTNGYDVCVFKEMVQEHCMWSYFREIYPLLNKIALKIIINSRKILYVGAYLRAVQCYSMWKIFASKFNVKIFLTFQDAGTPARSLCHRLSGSKSVFILWSTISERFYRKDMSLHVDSYYGCMIYDAVISSKLTNDYCKKNNNIVESYYDCGIFLSDKIFEVKHNPDKKRNLKEKLGVPPQKITVGFCDTTIGRNNVLNIQEGFKMYADVYRFLESDDRYQLVYKNRGYSNLLEINHLKEKVDKLISHPRVSYVNKLMPGCFAYDIMGICDIVIGIFSSSAVLETVAGGIRSVCYVPSERFDKDVFIVTTFPNFSVRNYDELEKCCKYWLYQSNERDFAQFQDNYLKKYVDTYCDGKASKRLQLRLQHLFN